MGNVGSACRREDSGAEGLTGHAVALPGQVPELPQQGLVASVVLHLLPGAAVTTFILPAARPPRLEQRAGQQSPHQLPAGHWAQVTSYARPGKYSLHSLRLRLRPAIVQARSDQESGLVSTVQVLPSMPATSRPLLSGR
jgi:hypothetical protein